MDTSLVSILSLVFGFLGSGSAFMTWLLYRGQSVRIKNAEAYEQEVNALRTEIEELRKAIEFERNERKKDGELITKLGLLNRELHDRNFVSEIKNAKNKGAINKAYECPHCPDSKLCPVLQQRKRNEEEYLAEVRQKRNDDVQSDDN